MKINVKDLSSKPAKANVFKFYNVVFAHWL